MEIIYLADPIYGGWVTYTAHLAKILGKSIVFKSTKLLHKRTNSFGYGIAYQNIPKEALRVIKHKIITAIDKNNYDCLPYLDNCFLVLHDPTEFTPEIIDFVKSKNIKVIAPREQVQKALSKLGVESTLILHPFYQYPTVKKEKKGKKGVSISRIDFDKHTDIILKANKMIEEKTLHEPIYIYGALNKMYEFHKLKGMNLQKYYRGVFTKSFQAVSEILADASYMVDMSAIKKDGGGTQYTFLEAIHNDCIPILNKKWFENGTGEMKPLYNCFAVSDERELLQALSTKNEVVLANGKQLLEAHSGADFLKFLSHPI